MKMKASVIIDGYVVGYIEYDLPKDSRGREIPIPSSTVHSSRLSVIVSGPDELTWAGHADLERF